MSPIKIITDSTAYLPDAYIKQYDIDVVTLSLIWEGKVYYDGIDISATEFYTRMTQTNALPTTSQVPVSDFETIFRKNLETGKEVLVLPVSSGLSGTYESALKARESFPEAAIEIVDTKLVSMALSFMVLAAARAAEQGASLAECKAVAEEAYSKIGVYFIVQDLKYLAAGGRINSAKRLMGTALNIKPLLEIRDGKIEAVESIISMRKGIDRMVQLIERNINGREPVRVSVFHALALKEAEELLARVTQKFNAVESILSEVSPVIGSHVGPGTLSIAYMVG
jgi:DegV family protein with EDD domain